MVGGNVKVTIIDNSDKIKGAFARQMQAALEEVGQEAESNAVIEVDRAVYDTPMRGGYIRTGSLRNSITHAKDAHAAYVGSNLEYAPYVEMGTSKMAARPFIKPAVENYMDDYKEIVMDHMKS